MILRSLDEADDELSEVAAYYEEQREDLGDDFLEVASSFLDQILRQPHAWPLAKGWKEVRRAKLGRFPYYLIFLPLEEEVVVIAYAHQRRRPDYWADRLDDV